MLGIVYLLHFERPISVNHTCQHYTGWALDLNARLTMHRAGKGARLTQIAIERGIGFEVVRTWPGSREFERYLKNRKESPRLCPMCCQIHGWQPRRIPLNVEQLALPLDIPDEFPHLAPGRADWLEMQITRGWRQARSHLYGHDISCPNTDDLL
jgi:hypothetical protein